MFHTAEFTTTGILHNRYEVIISYTHHTRKTTWGLHGCTTAFVTHRYIFITIILTKAHHGAGEQDEGARAALQFMNQTATLQPFFRLMTTDVQIGSSSVRRFNACGYPFLRQECIPEMALTRAKVMWEVIGKWLAPRCSISQRHQTKLAWMYSFCVGVLVYLENAKECIWSITIDVKVMPMSLLAILLCPSVLFVVRLCSARGYPNRSATYTSSKPFSAVIHTSSIMDARSIHVPHFFPDLVEWLPNSVCKAWRPGLSTNTNQKADSSGVSICICFSHQTPDD